MSDPMIGIDMDGVLVNWIPDALSLVNERLGSSFIPEDVTEFNVNVCLGQAAGDIIWNEVINSPTLYDDRSPEPLALETVEELGKLGRVVIVSSPSLGHIESKYRWLLRHGFHKDDIYLVESKEDLPLDVLVDDRAKTCLRMKDRAVLFDRPWNRHVGDALPRARGWAEVTSHVEDVLWLRDKPSVAQEAHSLVYGPRGLRYGSAYENDSAIAAMWSQVIRRATPCKDLTIPPRLVALMMMCVKISREAFHPNRDNRVDISGYSITADQTAP